MFWFTVVYGLNHVNERMELWDSLREYHSKVHGPWIVGGDFNAVMARNERIGGAPVSNAEIKPMLQTIQDCHHADLNARVSFFTWSNKHESDTKVYSRIDRVFINAEWTDIFPDGYVHFLPEGTFDHCPCLVNCEVEHKRRGATFKYFNMWSLAPGYSDIVRTGWQKECQGTPMYMVITKLKGLKAALKTLNKEQFANIENLTHVAELALQNFQEQLILDPLNEQLCQNEKECAKEVNDLRKAKHQFLSQKAKLTAEEVKTAMFDIPGTKASGLDGYSSQFFKDNWDIVGHDVIAVVQGAFQSGKVLKQSNNTIITLIPKVELHETVMQFRPIACCNTVYKCLSKVICARLGQVLPDIINPYQSAFIKGRDIVENILICQDLRESNLFCNGLDDSLIRKLKLSLIYQPLKEGDLGLRDLHSWNIAAIGKYVWWVAMKADHLWVKWVHVVYVKHSRWKDYEPVLDENCCYLCGLEEETHDHLFLECIYNGELFAVGERLVFMPSPLKELHYLVDWMETSHALRE
ncbi:uncharacterized protein LOC141637860 [Silene latifolia]|uniref:uncharacterized protein LOC141637860 n=1 Tax=Silene latifolia TaxID=37657 RepID=UPI003D78397C